jgi:hypothetical protein
MPGCESPLAAYVLDQDGSATLFLAGELDMASGPVLAQSIDEVVRAHLAAVTLDV